MFDKEFFPVGFQYYRAPSPLKRNWDKDLRKISEDGFNVVKYWVQWRWSEPEQGSYYFDDIDELMDLAHKYDLKVILNVIFDVAPTWFYQAHPDAVMVSNSGEKVHARAIDCRQIGGGPGPCFHHDDANASKDAFLGEAVKRYAEHPALYCWDLWNEPELTTGVKRALNIDDLMCYCDHSVVAFIQWLKAKYKTLEALNASWSRNYRQWHHVEAPRRFSTFNDMIDWRLFFMDTITRELNARIEVTKKYDKTHPVMCHTVPIPLFNSITCASDDWALAENCDLFGNSVGSMPFPADMLMSAARGKKVINSEIHAVVGKTLIPHMRPTMDDMLSHVFMPLIRGVEGFVFWQYRPEVLGIESPAWGSVDLEGQDTSWHKDLKEINHFLQREKDLILEREPVKRNIGIYVDPKNEVFTWIATQNLELYNESLEGAYNLFYDNNCNVVFIREEDLASEAIKDVDLIWMPPQMYFNETSAACLQNWVSSGGLLISEGFMANYGEEDGLRMEVSPGYNLTEVFGVKQSSIKSAEMMGNSYDQRITKAGESDKVTITLDTNGKNLTGHKYIVGYEQIGYSVQVLGHFADGTDAVFEHTYGQGKAIMIASMVSQSYKRNEEVAIRDFVSQILTDNGIHGQEVCTKDTNVRVDCIRRGDEGILFLYNNTQTSRKVLIEDKYDKIESVFNRNLKLNRESDQITVEVEDHKLEILRYS